MKIFYFIALLFLVEISWAQQADPTKYCTSAPTNSTFHRINAFSLKEISYTNTTTCTTYNNQTAKGAGMYPGETVSGSIQLGSCSGNTTLSSVRIFIDWNGDFDFVDTGETVYTSTSASTPATFAFSFTVPSTVSPGFTTMMRVVNQYNSSNILSCGSYSYGETQDYTIQITMFSDTNVSPLSGQDIRTIEAGDFDNDGDLDLIVKEASTPSVRLYRNNSTPGNLVLANTGYTFPSNIEIDGFLDFNNDGFLDVMTHLSGGAASVYLSNGGTSFTATALSFGSSINTIDWADYDKDGDLDFLVNQKVFRQLPDKTFENSTSTTNGTMFFDYDNDNDYDISDGRYIYTNVTGNFEQTHNLFPSNEGQGARSPVYHDFDNDGDLDIAVIQNVIEYSQIFFRYFKNEAGSFIPSTPTVKGDPGLLLEPIDFDHNGKPDIVYIPGFVFSGPPDFYYGMLEVNSNGDLVRKYWMPSSSISLQPNILVAGDFDKDGQVDFITSGYNLSTSPYTRFYRNRSGTTNASPSIPADLKSTINGDQVKLQWTKSTDDHTSDKSLFYNLEIRRGSDTLKSSFSRKSGSRKVFNKGNATIGTEFNLDAKELPQGLYSWSVQAIDQEQKASGFAAEGTFELVNTNYSLTKITNATVIKSVYNTGLKEYLVAYIQNSDVYYQRLDVRGQKIDSPVKLNLISTGCTDLEITTGGAGDAEYFIGWIATEGVYAKRIISGNNVNELLIDAKGRLDIAVAYNSTNSQYGVFYSYDEVTSITTAFLKAVAITPSGAASITKGSLITMNTFTSTNGAAHKDITISYNKDFNCYVAGWVSSWSFSIYGLGNSLYPTDLRFQLFSPSFASYNTPITINPDAASDISLKMGFNNQYLAMWTDYDQFPTTGSGGNVYDYVYETKGAKLKLGGTSASPTLVLEQIPYNLSKASTQGTLYSGTSGPSHVFDTKRNEFFMIWGNNTNGYLKLQRYDGFDAKLILKDESRINDYKGGKTNIAFNYDRNDFLICWVNGSDVYYTQYKNPKDDLPVITSIDKPKAYAGDKIVLTGNFFSKTSSLNGVKFGSTNAAITNTYSDGKRIEAIVPDGLGRTPVLLSVTFDDQVGTSSFLFEPLTLHSITSVDKTIGERGEVVTISGTKFSEDPTQLIIRFNDAIAELTDIVSNTSTEIKVKVPIAATRGTNPLTVSIQGQVVTAPSSFRVIVPPQITSVEALEGFISCKTITIKGIDFVTDTTLIKVKFGEVTAKSTDFIALASTALIVKVPIGADGNKAITVTVDDRSASTVAQQIDLGSKVSSYKNPGKIELTNRSTDAVSLQVKVLNQCSVNEIKLWRKGISEENSSWASESLTGLEDNRVDLTLGEDKFKNDPIGLALFYQVMDRSGKIAYSDTFNIYKQFTEFDSTNFVPSLVFGGSSGDYNIVSIPYEMNPNKVTSVFKDIFNTYGYDSTQWRIFHYLNDGKTPKYVEYLKGLNEIQLGKSYWIIVRHKQDIFFEGAQSVDLSQGPYEIILQPGWNQIGNPYNFNVSWSDIMTFNGNPTDIESLKTFKNGAFTAGTVMSRFSGGFVRNNRTTPVGLKIPFIKNKSINGRKSTEFNSDINSDQWQFGLTLQNASLVNELAKIGMHPQASEEEDSFDEHLLPHFNQYLDIKFDHNLSASITKNDETYSWKFEVSTNTGDNNLELNWASSQLSDDDKNLYLHDLDREKIIDMRAADHYAFNYAMSKRFKIYYGKEEDVKGKIIPEKILLGDAYPNPFTQFTTMPFTVTGEEAQVRLAVYNLQGQEVSVVIDKKLENGFYEAEWNGSGSKGESLPSGTYIVRLQIVGSNSASLVGKIILVR